MFDKKLIYTIAAIAVIAVASSALSSIDKMQPPDDLGEAVSISEKGLAVENPTDTPHTEKNQRYIVKEHNGHIAVFLEGEDTPQMVLETQIKFLPDYDRILITQGIPVEGFEALSALIEDYIS